MGRPSNRLQKRKEIVQAFAYVLADHGYAGATIAAVASEAGITPGLIHHHFSNKAELLDCLLEELIARFRTRLSSLEPSKNRLHAYGDAALSYGQTSDRIAAKCWVGVFAEAVRNPKLFAKVRRLLDTEIVAIQSLSSGKLSSNEAGTLLAYIMGALVFGAFAPQKTSGFAAPGFQQLVAALQ